MNDRRSPEISSSPTPELIEHLARLVSLEVAASPEFPEWETVEPVFSELTSQKNRSRK